MKTPENQVGSQERIPQLLFKVTLMRHEKPYYKDEGHDLTPEGVAGAINTGKRFREEKIISDEDEIILAHSPKPRAKGTLDFVAEGAGLAENIPRVEVSQLRASDYADHEAFMGKFADRGFDLDLIAEDHYKDPMFENRPDIVEPHSHKKERLYRAFEYLIRWFDSHPREGKTPHIIVVSHFEIITHIIDDVFGIENMKSYNSPSFGEAVQIEAYDLGDDDRVQLKVTYNGQTKDVNFNRKERSIEVM